MLDCCYFCLLLIYYHHWQEICWCTTSYSLLPQIVWCLLWNEFHIVKVIWTKIGFFGGLRKPQPSIIKRKKRIMLVSKNGKIQNNQTNEQSRIINSNTFQPTILIPTINSLVVNVQYSVSHCLEHRDYLVV